MAAAMSGAVDLSALKERAKAKASPATNGDSPATAAVAVTEATFEAEVLQRSMQVPVVVALTSSRSRASTELATALERLVAADNGSWVLATVDVDSNMRIAQAFGVQAIPTVVAVAAGQPLADFQGDQGDAELRRWIDAVLRAVEGKLGGPQPADQPEEVEDPRFTAAEDALENGDYAAAEAAYQTILDAEPGNAQAQAAIRQARFFGRASQVAIDAIAVADADPNNVSAALAAADAQLLSQDPEAAFARLIALISRTAGDERTTVRTRLLELFELFDAAEPFVIAARRKLATALY